MAMLGYRLFVSVITNTERAYKGGKYYEIVSVLVTDKQPHFVPVNGTVTFRSNLYFDTQLEALNYWRDLNKPFSGDFINNPHLFQAWGL